MPVFKCDRCQKKFYDKYHFERHTSRKISCNATDQKENLTNNYCDKCDKYFSRPYTLKRHQISICNKNTPINSNKAKTNKGNINQIINTGNKNKIIIKQYNLLPFGKDGIECLSTPDKIAIFLLDEIHWK